MIKYADREEVISPEGVVKEVSGAEAVKLVKSSNEKQASINEWRIKDDAESGSVRSGDTDREEDV